MWSSPVDWRWMKMGRDLIKWQVLILAVTNLRDLYPCLTLVSGTARNLWLLSVQWVDDSKLWSGKHVDRSGRSLLYGTIPGYAYSRGVQTFLERGSQALLWAGSWAARVKTAIRCTSQYLNYYRFYVRRPPVLYNVTRLVLNYHQHNHLLVLLKGKGKVFPLQARCGPEDG